jgi:hypothetical protein
MKISRISPLTHQDNTMDLDVTDAQLAELASWPRRKIQDIFPNLAPDEREFLLTGYTQEDWDKMFPEGDDE